MRRTVLLLLILAGGCASNDQLRPGADRPASVTSSLNLSGFPPEFRRGFTDGCSAARSIFPGARPKGEGQYVAGWQDGFDYCKARASN